MENRHEQVLIGAVDTAVVTVVDQKGITRLEADRGFVLEVFHHETDSVVQADGEARHTPARSQGHVAGGREIAGGHVAALSGGSGHGHLGDFKGFVQRRLQVGIALWGIT